MPCTSWPGLEQLHAEDEVRQGRNNMAGEKSGTKPEKPGGLGMEKDPPAHQSPEHMFT